MATDPYVRPRPMSQTGPATRSSPAFDVLIPVQPTSMAWTAGEPSLSFPARQKRRGWSLLALLIGPAVLAGLGTWGLYRHGAYGSDESATRWAATLPLGKLFHVLAHVDAVHGLYYLTIHAWIVFGRGPVALRLPSLIAAVLAAGVITELGRRLSGRLDLGIIAGLLYAISPVVMFYAQTARSYAIVSLVVASATLAFVRALEAGRDGASSKVQIRRWVGYGALIALGGWLNEIALLAVVAHAVTLVVTGYPRRVRLQWLVTSIVAVAMVVPLFVISNGESAAVDWVTKPTPHDLLTLLRDFFGPNPVVMVLMIGCTVFACIPSLRTRSALKAGTAREAWRTRGPASLVSVALPLLVVPPVLLVVESELTTPLYVERYLLYSVIGAVLLIAEGAIRIGHRIMGANPYAWVWIPAFAMTLVTFVVQLPTQQLIRTPDARLRDFGAPAKYIGHHAQPGDGVLYFSSFFRLVELGYPDDFRNLTDVGVAQTPEQAGTFRGVDTSFEVAAARMLTHNRLWVIGRQPLGTQPTTLNDEERDLLVDDYHLVRLLQFHGLTVSLFERRSLRLSSVEFSHRTGAL